MEFDGWDGMDQDRECERKREGRNVKKKQRLLQDAAGQNSVQMHLPGKSPFSTRCRGMQPDVAVTSRNELLPLD